MWVNIDIVPQREEIVYLPAPLADRLNDRVRVIFGKRNSIARVVPVRDTERNTGHDFNNPLKIRISDRLGAGLLIPKSPTYRMKYNRGNIVIGPVIGLLLGNKDYSYSPEHMDKYSDRFGVYDRVGGLIYAFSPKAIDWENRTVYGLYYNPKRRAWRFGRFPYPSAIYRRDFHSDHEDIKKLIEITGGNLFNSWRFTKSYLNDYISRDRELSRYVPPSRLSENFEHIKKFIDMYHDIILKPTSLSRGRGICIIRRDGDIYRVFDYRAKKPEEIELDSDDALEKFFDKNECFFNSYLVQRCLSLAKIDGSSFDIRVVMQKEKPNEWQCSGIECRVAASGLLLTNISRGGYALTIDEALNRAFPGDREGCEDLKEQIDRLCLKICRSLDRLGHHFGEFGMDIAVDEDKHLWIIEVNVFPSFKGFKTMDYNTYLKIRYTPILYAAHLTGF
jgi:glutathione synthase/RimK-type ligase-like ATP-grasp enzyme